MNSLNWETEIYKKKKQINSYPFDCIVASTNKYFKSGVNKIVLDLGCGTGNNTKFFIEYKFKKIHGVDVSKSAIKIAQKFIKKKSKVKFINKNFKDLKLRENFFDLICDRGSMTHTSKKFMNNFYKKQAYSSLKKGGYIFSWIFSSSHYASKKSSYNAFKKETKSKGGLLTSFYTKNEINIIFKKFKIINLIEEKKINYLNKKKINSVWFIVAKKV